MDQSKATKKSSDVVEPGGGDISRPKRFLTAYNFFFMRERAAILNSGEDENETSSTTDETFLAAARASKSWTKKKGKRLHVKSHGKIEFLSLGKAVAARWKALSAEERKVYDDLAKEDIERYRRELRDFKKKLKERSDKLPVPSDSAESVQSKPRHKTDQTKDMTKQNNKRSESKTLSTESNSSSQRDLGKKRPPLVLSRTQNDRAPCSDDCKETMAASGAKKKLKRSWKERDASPGTTFDEVDSVSKGKNHPMVYEKDVNHRDQRGTKVDKNLPYKDTDHDNILVKADKGQTHVPFNSQANKLYGRDQQISEIMNAYERLVQCKSSPEMVMISGYSGVGKSALVQHVKKPITNLGGRFICGKFDCFRQMEPLSAIIVALTEFCNEVSKMSAENQYHIKSAVQEMLGSETDILAGVIPNFRQVFQTTTSNKAIISTFGKEAQYRLKNAFRLFFRAITSPNQLFVLFLDDLQWADLSSLNFIESLVTDTKNKSLFVICSYRNNEVGDMHPLVNHQHEIESKGVTITNIKVNNLSRESVNDLISDMLQASSDSTQSLSNAVYRKTNGNVLFVRRFLRSIHDEGLLEFQSGSKQWQWDAYMIESKKIADNVVGLMLHKIMQLSNEIQRSLKLMACMGSYCEEWILTSLMLGDGIYNLCNRSLFASLQLAVKEGLVDYVCSTYTFAHDHIQHAAYSLIPVDERAILHLQIGHKLWANRAASPEKALFIAAGQFNKGTTVITNVSQRVEVAKLNLQAGEKSMALTAFVPAAFYLKIGINLLGEGSWVNHYDLCLKLHTLCAEAEYGCGEFQEMDRTLTEIFANGISPLDKFRAYITSINALFAQCKTSEALNLGLQILAQLGEPMATNPDSRMIMMVEHAKTKQLMEGKTDAVILSSKVMEDEYKIAAMRVMNLLALTSFFTNEEMFALFALRSVQLSLQYGISNESAFSFASYGALIVPFFEDFIGASRFGKLALSLLGASKAKECIPGVYVVVYSLIYPFTEHFRASIQPLEYAYKVGMNCGYFNYAMFALRNYSSFNFFCGENLVAIERRIRWSIEEMVEHKQDMLRLFCLPFRQACLNLMGYSDDPILLTGEAMDQEQLLKEAREKNQTRLVGGIYHACGWIAYIFGDYETASRFVKERQAAPLKAGSAQGRFLFVDGLIAFATAHKADRSKWSAIANKCLDKLDKYALHSPSNYQHMLLLLQAESAFLIGNCDFAANKYDTAIKNAGAKGFIHDQAIACERAGIFYSEQGVTDMASRYYLQAYNAFLKWGATRKADHMRQKYSF